MTEMSSDRVTSLEYHVLLAMAEGPRYGYAIKSAVEDESAGALAPRAGSLYRVLARLIGSGLVVETPAPAPTEPHPGRTRKYYGLTPAGRRTLAAEARRLLGVSTLASERLGVTEDAR